MITYYARYIPKFQRSHILSDVSYVKIASGNGMLHAKALSSVYEQKLQAIACLSLMIQSYHSYSRVTPAQRGLQEFCHTSLRELKGQFHLLPGHLRVQK